ITSDFLKVGINPCVDVPARINDLAMVTFRIAVNRDRTKKRSVVPVFGAIRVNIGAGRGSESAVLLKS
ncbi:MAG TPA: hypothetical protein VI479_21615, partial [Blastocatellia bacterium]